jgi:hypothetical protein
MVGTRFSVHGKAVTGDQNAKRNVETMSIRIFSNVAFAGSGGALRVTRSFDASADAACFYDQ